MKDNENLLSAEEAFDGAEEVSLRTGVKAGIIVVGGRGENGIVIGSRSQQVDSSIVIGSRPARGVVIGT